MANNRRRGHDFERTILNELRSILFDGRVEGKEEERWDWRDDQMFTSRNESRRLDAAGVDLVGTYPINFQLKLTKSGSINYVKVLDEMPEGEHNVVLHRRGQYSKRRDIVAMNKETFYYLLTLILKKYNSWHEA